MIFQLAPVLVNGFFIASRILDVPFVFALQKSGTPLCRNLARRKKFSLELISYIRGYALECAHQPLSSSPLGLFFGNKSPVKYRRYYAVYMSARHQDPIYMQVRLLVSV